MEAGSNRTGTRAAAFLSRRDWVYLASLLIPFIAYDLALKGLLIAAWPEDPGFWGSLGLMWSDLMFNLGYAVLWVGLFAAARGKKLRRLVVGLFHIVTIVVALISTFAYQYFRITGSTLDSDYILLWLSSPEGTGGVIANELSFGIVVLLLAVLLYAILGPLVVTRLVARWRGWSGAGERPGCVPWLKLAGVGLTIYALFSFSLLGGGPVGASKSFSRDAVVNVVTTAAAVADGQGIPSTADAAPPEPPPEANLEAEAGAEAGAAPEKRNVVLIFLESTRARATTPYNPDLQTTPFMDELAQQSVLAEKAYAVVPHTHNALTASNCGVEPPLDRWGTLLLGARENVVPSTCLAELLEKQGYNSAYFMSQTSDFERSPKILENLGYEEFYSVEGMDTENFEQTSYFGYEDEILLEPSREWLTEQKQSGDPFLATYLTSAPHHQYLAPEQRHGRVDFTENPVINRYLNSVRNQDFFLQSLFEQYKRLGLYEDTVFIVLGDHGEGFGEHGRFQHDNVPYEEGLKIPFLIHDPQQFQNGARVAAPVSQLDVLPTVTDLLGYEIEGGDYRGRSVLQPLPADRTLMFSCWNEAGCLASLEGDMKYIYHFGDKPDELFDLSSDPSEQRNLAAERPEEVERRRQELLEWRAKVGATYGMQVSE